MPVSNEKCFSITSWCRAYYHYHIAEVVENQRVYLIHPIGWWCYQDAALARGTEHPDGHVYCLITANTKEDLLLSHIAPFSYSLLEVQLIGTRVPMEVFFAWDRWSIRTFIRVQKYSWSYDRTNVISEYDAGCVMLLIGCGEFIFNAID